LRQKAWFEAFLYIFNKHWDKVDNFRIDKYLMMVRYMFHDCLKFFKSTGYAEEDIEWLCDHLDELMSDAETAQGIPLQICDVFLPELCKVDSGVSLVLLQKLLQPFLTALSMSDSAVLKERIRIRIFEPLLESNVTMPDSSDESSDEDLTQVDGGKLSKRTRKEVSKLINTKYVFPAFNILIYAENAIFPQASAKPYLEKDQETVEAETAEGEEEKKDELFIREENRETVYDLYY